MAVSKSYNRHTNTWYAYETEYIWDELGVMSFLKRYRTKLVTARSTFRGAPFHYLRLTVPQVLEHSSTTFGACLAPLKR